MSTFLQVTGGGASTARAEVETLGGQYETSLRYPVLGLVRAPKAQAARDDLKTTWDTRREAELDGVDAIAAAISAIAMSFGDADSGFNVALEELMVARTNAEGGE